MIRFPHLQGDTTASLAGTTLADWLPADDVYSALRLAVQAHAVRPALRFLASGQPDARERHYSYAQFLAGVTQAANLLRSLGVQRGDVVAYLLPSLPETQFVLWGACTAGIAMPINPLLQVEEIVALLNAAKARVLVALGPVPGSDWWDKARRVMPHVPTLAHLVRVGGAAEAPDGGMAFREAMAEQPATLAFGDLPAAHDVASIFHTGGTTGGPKLVALTHRNQLAAAYGGACAVRLTSQDVMLNGLPMFHVAATQFASLAMLLGGAEIVLLSPLGFREPSIVRHFWRIVQDTRASIVGGVPTALAAVLAQDATGFDLSRVRLNVSGAAQTPRAVAEGMERVTGRPLHEIYGMTECAGIISVDPVGQPRVLGCAGVPVAFCEVQARQADPAAGPAVCPPGEPGVLAVRGPNVTPGYLDAAHNRGLFTQDGWLLTGDLGYVDARGRVFITGRHKDLIIRGGHNIDPAAIEDCLRRHPGVGDVVAVGMPDAYAGEVPVAYVVPRAGRALDEAALLRFASAHIAEPPARPRRLIVVDALPLTAVGKVFRPALRRDAAQRHFRQLLQGEAISDLAVHDDARRGRRVRIALHENADDAPALRRRIAQSLADYAVTIDWA